MPFEYLLLKPTRPARKRTNARRWSGFSSRTEGPAPLTHCTKQNWGSRAKPLCTQLKQSTQRRKNPPDHSLRSKPSSRLSSDEKKLALFMATVLAAVSLPCFPGATTLFYLLMPPGLLLLTPSLLRFLRSRRESREARDFSELLDYLSARMSAGVPLIRCLLEAPHAVSDKIREKSRMREALLALSTALAGGLGLSEAFARFDHFFCHPLAQSFSRVLPRLEALGGKPVQYLRLQRDSLHRLLRMEEEVKAEASSSSAEAFAMSAMPFVLSFMSASGLYSFGKAQTVLASGIFYLAALLNLSLVLHLSSPLKHRDKLPRLPLLRDKPWLLKKSSSLPTRLGRLYPGDCERTLRHCLEHLLGRDQNLWLRYCEAKICLALLSLALALLFLPAGLWGLSLISLFLPNLFLDLKVLDADAELRRQAASEYPLFLNFLSVLLLSGLSLQRALDLAFLAFAEANTQRIQTRKAGKDPPGSLLQRDLKSLERQLSGGGGTAESLDRLAALQADDEIARLLHLFSRYEREGGREQLEMIQLQAGESLELYRRAERAREGRKTLLYLLPMGLDLLLVMAISLLPALSSFALF